MHNGVVGIEREYRTIISDNVPNRAVTLIDIVGEEVVHSDIYLMIRVETHQNKITCTVWCLILSSRI